MIKKEQYIQKKRKREDKQWEMKPQGKGESKVQSSVRPVWCRISTYPKDIPRLSQFAILPTVTEGSCFPASLPAHAWGCSHAAGHEINQGKVCVESKWHTMRIIVNKQ